MNEPKHTPGPWSYSPPFDDGSMLRSSWQPAIIGRWEPPSEGKIYPRLVEICAFEFRMTPSEADGRLMAAAPTMYETIKSMMADPAFQLMQPHSQALAHYALRRIDAAKVKREDKP